MSISLYLRASDVGAQNTRRAEYAQKMNTLPQNGIAQLTMEEFRDRTAAYPSADEASDSDLLSLVRP